MKKVLIFILSIITIATAGNLPDKYPVLPDSQSVIGNIDLFPFWALKQKTKVQFAQWSKVYTKDFTGSILTRRDSTTDTEYALISTVIKTEFTRVYTLYSYYRTKSTSEITNKWQLVETKELVTYRHGEFFLPK